MDLQSKLTSAEEVNAVSLSPIVAQAQDDLRRELEYICKKENVWDREAYRNSKINGKLTPGDEVSFNLQYVLGAAFLRGHTESIYFNIFYRDNQGFQVYVAPSYKELDEMKRCTFSEMPGEWQAVHKKLVEYHQSNK